MLYFATAPFISGKNQARAYAALVGGSEAGLSYLFSGIGKLGGKVTGNAVSKLVDKAAQAYLPYINDIVKNAVLLDSYAIDSGKTKSPNSLMMHSMYAVADIGKGPEVLKLYVEEMNDPNKSTTVKRVYQLQNIEKQQLNAKGSGKSPSPVISTATINNVADLFAAVKAKDTAFQPKTAQKTANGKVGWDGREVVEEATGPKVTVGGKTYVLLGYDENGSKVYQDAEVLKEQAAKEKTAENQDKATQTENGQEAVENSEDRDILTLSTRYLNKNDSLYEYSGKITPLEGFEDVVTHGDPISLVFKDADGKESNVSAEEFVQILKDDPNYKGGNIRLVACQVAANGGAIPKYIAKELGVTVIAPTESVNVDWDGNMFLADEQEDITSGIETGEWLVFEPGKEGVSYDLYWKIQ